MSDDYGPNELYANEFDQRNGTDEGQEYMPNLKELIAKLDRGEARHFTDEALDRICATANLIASAAQAERRFRA